jgi:hypothetical protein
MRRRSLQQKSFWIALLVILAGVSLPSTTFAQTYPLNLAWDPVTNTEVDHYRLYIGTSPAAHDVAVLDVATPNYEFAATPGVLYYFAVSAVSPANFEGALSAEIAGSIPILFQPADRVSTIGVPIVPMHVFAYDADGGSLRFGHTGLPLGLVLDPVTGIITGIPTMLGATNVQILVSDGVFTMSQTFVWTVQSEGIGDLTAPSLSITSHVDGQSVATGNLTVSGTATDSGLGDSGINNVWVNGLVATGGRVATNGTANWSRALTLPAASNSVLVEALDGAGNYTASVLTLNRDLLAPSITITSHTAGQVVNASSITLTGTATDQGMGGNGVTSVTVNGAPAGGTAIGGATATWSSPVTLVNGPNVLTVMASDIGGNTRTLQITIVRDATIPALAITSHSSNQTVTSGTVTLSGWASDNGTGGSGIAGVTVNGVAATGGTAAGNATATWSRSLALSVGANLLTISAIDGVGNVRTTNITLNFLPAAALTADSVAPASGSGLSQTFTLQYSSNLGATNVSTAWVWFNATLASTSANSCLLYYDRSAGGLNLLNDGSTWLQGMLGSNRSLFNSQCAVDLAGSSVTSSGNTLTLTLAMSFSTAYAGAKNIYLYAANGAGVNSGWQTRGAWTVSSTASTSTTGGSSAPTGGTAGTATPVAADAVSPANGSGMTQTFALQYSDTAGAADLSTMWVWFNATLSSTSGNSCLIYYNRSNATLNLLNDAGSAWMPAMFGSSSTLYNSQCAVSLAGSSITSSGNTVTLNLAMSFSSVYVGAKNVYLYAANGAGVNSGWQTRGAWTVSSIASTSTTGGSSTPTTGGSSAPTGGTASTATPVAADAVSPASGSGMTQTFALQYSASAGAADLSTMWVWFNATLSSTSGNSCLIYYDRSNATLNLLNDAGSAWMPAMFGSSSTLYNSQCAISLAGSSITSSGNTVTLNLAMSFSSVYVGAKNIYLYAANGAGVNSGWQTRGTWTVSSVSSTSGGGTTSGGGGASGGGTSPDTGGTGATPGAAVVTADAATPANGSGMTGIVSLQYSDTRGGNDLSTAWVWINATFASTSNDSCLLYYDRATGSINLLNDAGTTWMSGTLGYAGALENTQCSVSLSQSFATITGNTLTLTLSMSYAPRYAGTKHIYMYAANAGSVNSGWQDRALWTVR